LRDTQVKKKASSSTREPPPIRKKKSFRERSPWGGRFRKKKERDYGEREGTIGNEKGKVGGKGAHKERPTKKESGGPEREK